MNQSPPPFECKLLGVRWPDTSQTGIIYPQRIGDGLDAVDAQEVGPGIRVVTGKNNAGKSRFLRLCAAAGIWRTKITRLLPQHFGNLMPFHADYSGSFQITDVPRDRNGLAAQSSAIAPKLNSLGPLVAMPPWREKWFVPADRYFGGDFSMGSYTTQLSTKEHWQQMLADIRFSRDLDGWDRINRAFTSITESYVEIHIQGAAAEIVIRDQRNSEPRKLNECGDGLRDVLGVLLHVYAKRDCDLFIEEPGTRLHPSAQRALLAVLEDEAKRRQVWIATHDAVFANAHSAVERFAVVRVKPPGAREFASQVSRVSTYKDMMRQRDALGWMPSDSVLASHVLYCEGESDAVFFKAILEDLESTDARFGGVVVTELGGCGVVWSGSNGGVKPTVDRVRGAAPHAKHVVILDDDNNTAERKGALEDAVNAFAALKWLPDAHELEDVFLSSHGTVAAIIDDARARSESDSGNAVALPPDLQAVIGKALATGDAKLKEARADKRKPEPAAKRVFGPLWHELAIGPFNKVHAASAAARHLRQTNAQTWQQLKKFVAEALEIALK